jgi:LPS sulfotransferase NodH
MLETIETGYEAKFDFPRRSGPPTRPYLFASVPRTGSTYVSHLLWQSGCLGAPLEYLNFEAAGPYGFAAGNPRSQADLWSKVLTHRTSPNGVFGLKAFPLQLQALQTENPALLHDVMGTILSGLGKTRIVQLRRRDRAAHAVSYARAILSGVWRSEQEQDGRVEPDYSERAMARALRMIDELEGAWSAMCRDLGLRPLVLWYEDVLADPDGAIAAVAAHIGVTLDPASVVAVPAIKRQSQSGAEAWLAQHAQGKG